MDRVMKSTNETIPTYSIESITNFLSTIESENNSGTLQQLRDKKAFVTTIYRGQLKHE
jgi:hypothetical protein